MRLYHSHIAKILFMVVLMTACSVVPRVSASIHVSLVVGGEETQVDIPAGSTVEGLLNEQNIILGALDRTEPPIVTLLAEGDLVRVIRVREEFEIEREIIPFDQQLQPSELLPEGEQQPLQMGENGEREITYRKVFEDGVEVSRLQVKNVILKEAKAQIMLVGMRTSLSPVSFPGRIVYLSDGNAWMLENNNSNRKPIITSGLLDGRIFKLSDNGKWLLFTQRDEDPDVINSLWVVKIDDPEILIDMEVENVIHYAGWQPRSSESVYYSTVEPRDSAPGWQANNDLLEKSFRPSGWVSPWESILETNSGGIYGWWGTGFEYKPEGLEVAYSQPGEIGVVDLMGREKVSLIDVLPLQTGGDWAWVPGISWSPDGSALYTVNHAAPAGSTSPEESPHFNLTAVLVDSRVSIELVTDVGMFAYPKPSPNIKAGSSGTGYKVAYLQAIFPNQSETSRYRVMIMDSDGSNRSEVFPPKESTGLEPHVNWGIWSPEPGDEPGNYTISLIYKGNLWIIDPRTGDSWQLTGDGRANRLDWK